jgi:hypothetical protein
MGAAGPAVTWLMGRSADKFMKQTGRFAAASQESLDKILAMSRGTEYGRRCGLDGAAPQKVFETLPTTTYSDYAPYIERMAAGEQNVLCTDPIIFFSTTSGTTGPPKMIPVTKPMMRLTLIEKFVSAGLAYRAGALKPMHGPMMTIMTEHLSGLTAGGVPKGAATTGGFKNMGPVSDMILSSPAEVMRVHDQKASRYLHLLFGLRHEHLWTILAFFPATILFCMRDLQAQSEQLLRDLADGTINPDLELPTEIRTSLAQRLRPDRARARALTKLLESDRFDVPHIWPDMGCILTATGGGFRFYADQLRPFLGDVPIFSPIYSASESSVGYGYSLENPYYLLLPEPSYLELLPEEQIDDPQARPIPAWQAKPDSSYEVVVTTMAGFLRYRLHDIVRVVDFLHQTPIVEFVERQGQLIDVVGEKTAEHHIAEAIAAACYRVKARLLDYFVSPDTEQTPASYLLAIESWQSGSKNSQLIRELLGAVEASLRQVAPDYDEERELGTLGPMALAVLKPGAFERLREKRIEAGGAANQIKTPHVIPDPGFLRKQFKHEILSHFHIKDR